MKWFRGWAVVTPRGTIVIDTATKFRRQAVQDVYDEGDKVCKVAVVDRDRFEHLLNAARAVVESMTRGDDRSALRRADLLVGLNELRAALGMEAS